MLKNKIDALISNANKKINNIDWDKINSHLRASETISLGKTVIDLRNLCFEKPVLDIGGSGEAIISKIVRNLTIIDLSFDNFTKSKNKIKMVMDATKMDFAAQSFQSLTIFYSLMYMDNNQVKRALEEAYRVLNQNGRLFIWDVCINFISNSILIAPLEIILPRKTVNLTYGSARIKEIRDETYYTDLLRDIGFKKIERHMQAYGIFLIAEK